VGMREPKDTELEAAKRRSNLIRETEINLKEIKKKSKHTKPS
jgi:hypothetical protein